MSDKIIKFHPAAACGREFTALLAGCKNAPGQDRS